MTVLHLNVSKMINSSALLLCYLLLWGGRNLLGVGVCLLSFESGPVIITLRKWIAGLSSSHEKQPSSLKTIPYNSLFLRCTKSCTKSTPNLHL